MRFEWRVKVTEKNIIHRSCKSQKRGYFLLGSHTVCVDVLETFNVSRKSSCLWLKVLPLSDNSHLNCEIHLITEKQESIDMRSDTYLFITNCTLKAK